MTDQPQPGQEPLISSYELIDAVRDFLRGRGFAPEVPPARAGMAVAGAGQLLRAFGIQPGMSMAAAVDRLGAPDER
jgi:hypothetical protein